MRLDYLSFSNSRSNVKINEVSFQRLNVLVGVSGAGKTTIISALGYLISLAEGDRRAGLDWDIIYTDDLGQKVRWTGKLSKDYETDTSTGRVYSKFVREQVFVDSIELISRDEKSITFDSISLPRLDEYTSLIYQFRSDDKIKSLYNAIVSPVIVNVDSEYFSKTMSVQTLNDNVHKEVLSRKGKLNIKLLSSQFKDLSCREKIYYAFKYDKESFEDFSFVYKQIFPDVNKIVPSLIRTHSELKEGRRVIFISIEMNNGQIITQGDISSGMFKTMMLLAELQLGNNNSPIIVDEIENSLGVNCLPDLLDELQIVENQIIITSHHPRVINVIPKKYWKIVSRDESGAILTYPALDVLDNDSNHDNFVQLLNSKYYRGK